MTAIEPKLDSPETPEHPATRQTADGQAYAPTPLPALGLPEIPTEQHFVRSHFPVPDVEPSTWTLTIAGQRGPLTVTLGDLTAQAPRTMRVVLECAGHRRIEIEPLPPGLPWSTGAVSEACWTGVALGPLLRVAGIPAGAREVVLEGADRGPFEGVPGEHSFARSLPLGKALRGDVLLAYAMNGRPISVARGGPVRAIVPGWYATDSVKWLTRISFTAAPFEGPFEALDYRLRRHGETGPGRRMTDLPVSSLITAPATLRLLEPGAIAIEGIAWGGEGGIAGVDVQLDGSRWRAATLSRAPGRYARTRWQLPVVLEPGRHTIASRATDGAGRAQPTEPLSNPGGYANHAVHRVEVTVASPRPE
jgi:sulfane dehydrogenase subunit SoxC